MNASLTGNLFLSISLLFGFFSVISYLYAWGRTKGTLIWGRRFYWVSALFSVGALVYLFYLFVAKHYEITYVAEYSSSDLPFHYLFSSVWAGQQGSFLLWLGLSALLGLFMLKRLGEYEERGMFFYSLVQLFLLFILIKRSPFEPAAQVLADGRGLNPLLQDFWMVIHPPVIFLGFAALAVPFALAMAALTRREYRGWVNVSFPWVNFAWLAIGAGIIVGGFWAYKVLGWGGYWGWDPVENASLMPFLAATALIHGFLIQKHKNALPKTNFLLALVTFLLVVYGTFLTRSGILADFSVHSFTDLGINGLLVLFLLTFVLFGFGMLLYRMREIKGEPYGRFLVNADWSVLVFMLVMAFSTALVFLGTSSPLITRLFGKAAAVDVSYYVKTHLPIGVLLAFLLAITPNLPYGADSLTEKLRKAFWPAILALGFAVVTFIAGFKESFYPLFYFLCFFALFSSFFAFSRRLAERPGNSGGYLAHIGVAMLLAGFIFSGVYSQSERMNLTAGEAKSAFGYTLTYKGTVAGAKPSENALVFSVEHTGKISEARPRFYWSEYNQGYMRNPAIQKGLLYDIYISPIDHSGAGEKAQAADTLLLTAGEARKILEYQITFLGFEGVHMNPEGNEFQVGAKLSILQNGRTQELTPKLIQTVTGQVNSPPVELPDKTKLSLIGVQADSRQVMLALETLPAAGKTADAVSIEVSKKPLIILVWLGSILLLSGGVLSTWRRAKERPRLLRIGEQAVKKETLKSRAPVTK
ncbi:MAG TPA: cytochrome c biogenesis protein CcsA [Verrucomicrobiae bacterium]|nr:cytochrome c biogenesis protein CcsA [Verrucomicrobiae bacterium]